MHRAIKGSGGTHPVVPTLPCFFAELSMSKTDTASEQAPRAADVAGIAKEIVANVEKVIIGKRQQLVLALVAYLCEGHILLEDVPGVAKTMLARALRTASARFSSGSSVRPTSFPPT